MKIFCMLLGAFVGAEALSLSPIRKTNTAKSHGKIHTGAVAKVGEHGAAVVRKKRAAGVMKNQVPKKSSITDGDLKIWNQAAGWSALAQGIVILVLYFVKFPDDNAKLTTTFLKFVQDQGLVQDTAQLNLGVNFVLGSSIFMLLTAFAHFSILTYLWDYYTDNIANHINTARWVEYSVTSTIMISLIAVAFGVYDISTLIGLAGANFVTQYFGYYMEKLNGQLTEIGKLSGEKQAVDWTPYSIGWIAGILPWVIIATYFAGSSVYGSSTSEIPTFVYAILGSYFFFFNTFPINQALQYAEVGPWKDYRFGELGYIFLSLASKSLLSWLVVGNAFQP